MDDPALGLPANVQLDQAKPPTYLDVPVSVLAALSINGSMASAVWFSPGPRCGPRGGVLVSTEMPRQRIAYGW